MSVVFALTVQSPLFRVEIYKNNSQMLHWPAGKLDMKLNNTLNTFPWCLLTTVEDSYRGEETNLGGVDRLGVNIYHDE
jgi:hypothetical protein